MIGWYASLEDVIAFSFEARCVISAFLPILSPVEN